ncbi:MAG: iron donor protein CyaY [Zoogloeaceae bacterium]|jgi:CyaY protein|nr:iron donor protein CyaY [Zoogloeaceae bacterium]
MNEQEFAEIARQTLTQIETRLEEAGVDYDLLSDGVLEAELPDGRRMVINRYVALQELWLAAPGGAYHFRWQDGAWRDTRSNETLEARLAQEIGCPE